LKAIDISANILSEENPNGINEETLYASLAKFFGVAHTNVLGLTEKMLQQLKRRFYVTPTNYIELVTGYVDMLKQK